MAKNLVDGDEKKVGVAERYCFLTGIGESFEGGNVGGYCAGDGVVGGAGIVVPSGVERGGAETTDAGPSDPRKGTSGGGGNRVIA